MTFERIERDSVTRPGIPGTNEYQPVEMGFSRYLVDTEQFDAIRAGNRDAPSRVFKVLVDNEREGFYHTVKITDPGRLQEMAEQIGVSKDAPEKPTVFDDQAENF